MNIPWLSNYLAERRFRKLHEWPDPRSRAIKFIIYFFPLGLLRKIEWNIGRYLSDLDYKQRLAAKKIGTTQMAEFLEKNPELVKELDYSPLPVCKLDNREFTPMEMEDLRNMSRKQ